MSAPERIWAWDDTSRTCKEKGFLEGGWTTEPCEDMHGASLYIRAVILALADQDALAEVQALKAERDQLRERVHALSFMGEGYAFVERRAEAAEAEVARLREALNHIDALDPEGHVGGVSVDAARGLVNRMGSAARAALTAPKGNTE